MSVHLLSGIHLTAHDKSAIATIVARGWTYGQSPRKSYHIKRDGAGLYSILMQSDGRQHALTVICDAAGEAPSWDEAKTLREQWAADERNAGAQWRAIRGVGSGPMGLTPDAVKFSPEYSAARRSHERAAERLGNLNKWIVRNYPKEARADARAARERGSAAA